MEPTIFYFIPTEKVQEVKKNFLQESGIQFSDLEEKVLQFHLSNLEYACGSTLDQVYISVCPCRIRKTFTIEALVTHCYCTNITETN